MASVKNFSIPKDEATESRAIFTGTAFRTMTSTTFSPPAFAASTNSQVRCKCIMSSNKLLVTNRTNFLKACSSDEKAVTLVTKIMA